MITERLGTYILYIFMIIYSGLLYSDLKKIWNLKHTVCKLLIYTVFIFSIHYLFLISGLFKHGYH